MADETNAIALLWKVLYGEELEQTPDPNKPENLPYYKARREQRRKELSSFYNGPGKVLFDGWEKRVKQLNLQLISSPEADKCSCQTCLIVRQIKSIMTLWIEAMQLMGQKQ
ncbi:MAG: hypothetical protein M0R06_18180 [Sphaerochaeta sp.]|jgi:hypothetical protein|nr:hypothetical protein [Dehalococcoidia bacterium]MCK9600976.1 hypothetical protein [Sphaerochaeta sp.]HOX40532.1 hypothetical protein [Candidatus Brocadiia bacterium]